LDMFEITPELSYVNLRGQISVLKPSLPITQLRELHVSHSYTLDEFLQTLHDAPNLVKFSLHLDSSEVHHLTRLFSTLIYVNSVSVLKSWSLY
jgi:hypothetical protein